MSEKQISCVVSCPISTYSGYGRRSLDFVKELIRIRPDWDIKILSTDWGHSKSGYLEDHREQDLLSRVIKSLDTEPDVWIQITVPGEFERRGKYNIGVTASIETTLCSYEWLEGCNKMDLVIVSSDHGRFAIENSVGEYKEAVLKLSGKVLRKPRIEVLFEGIDLQKFTVMKNRYKCFVPFNNFLETNWNFLCVGQWLPGDYGEDRKNIGYTIGMFLDTFKDMDDAPGLILKVNGTNTSSVDRNEITYKIRAIQDSIQYTTKLPPIYLLHGELTDYELNKMYNDSRVKAMVSFTKGEGFGKPLAEFAAIGKPIICSGWSGQMDFLSTKISAIVGGSLEYVHPSASNSMLLQNAHWFKPDDQQVVFSFQNMYNNYEYWRKAAISYSVSFRKRFKVAKMGEKLDRMLYHYFSI